MIGLPAGIFAKMGRVAGIVAPMLVVAACSSGASADHDSDVTIVRGNDAVPVARPTVVAQPVPETMPSPGPTPLANVMDSGEPPTPEETLVQ